MENSSLATGEAAGSSWPHMSGCIKRPRFLAATFVVFVRDRDLHGRGVGWIDVHLLASVVVRLQLWTVDPCFPAVANQFGAALRGANLDAGGTVLTPWITA